MHESEKLTEQFIEGLSPEEKIKIAEVIIELSKGMKKEFDENNYSKNPEINEQFN